MRAHASFRIMALVMAATTPAAAQMANASTAATGLGGAYTARAQGYNAVAWNPANLAMPGNPGFSFTIGALDGRAGMRPIDLKKIVEAGSTIDSATREHWMLDIEREGAQKGSGDGGVTAFGLSLGPIAFQLNTKVSSLTDLTPGAADEMIFSKKGRTGDVRELVLDSSAFAVSAYSTGAVSYGMRLPIIPLSDFAIGVTGKYTVGHGVGVGQSIGSSVGTGDEITMNFPYIRPSLAAEDAKEKNYGSGFGLDLGAAWRIPGFRFGVSAQNVVSTFKWDTTKLATRTAVGLASSTQESQFGIGDDSTETPYSTAPAVLRERIANQRFKPVLAAGVSFDWLPAITVSADIRQQVAGGIESGPESLVSAGAEVRWLPFLPLRAGVQMMTGGFGLAGGVGLRLLGLEAGIAGYVRTRDGAQESGATINLVSIRP